MSKKYPNWVIVATDRDKNCIRPAIMKPVSEPIVIPAKNTTLIAMMLFQKKHNCAYCKCELTKENAEIDKNDIGGPVLVCGRCNDRTK